MNGQPYHDYEATPAWSVIEQAIAALVENQDIKEMTTRGRIVGYLVKCLVDARVDLPATKKAELEK